MFGFQYYQTWELWGYPGRLVRLLTGFLNKNCVPWVCPLLTSREQNTEGRWRNISGKTDQGEIKQKNAYGVNQYSVQNGRWTEHTMILPCPLWNYTRKKFPEVLANGDWKAFCMLSRNTKWFKGNKLSLWGPQHHVPPFPRALLTNICCRTGLQIVFYNGIVSSLKSLDSKSFWFGMFCNNVKF